MTIDDAMESLEHKFAAFQHFIPVIGEMTDSHRNDLSIAVAFASAAHLSIAQTRKQSTEAYINHPVRVCCLMYMYGERDIKVLNAALLHDVVEDTKITLQDINFFFGERVADLVGWVTDVSTASDGNRAARKALDREHLAQAPREAQNIKLADIFDNADSIRGDLPEFAPTWLAEKKAQLEVLTKGDARLRMLAEGVVLGEPGVV